MHATLVMIVACVCAHTTVTTTQVLATTVCAYAMKDGVAPTVLSASASAVVCMGAVTMVYASAKLDGVEATATSKIVLQTATITVCALTAYVPASLTGQGHRATKDYAQVCAVVMVSASKRTQRAFALTSLLDQHATCVNVQHHLPTPPAVGMGSAIKTGTVLVRMGMKVLLARLHRVHQSVNYMDAAKQASAYAMMDMEAQIVPNERARMTAAIMVLASLTSLANATTTGKANCVTYAFAIRTARTMDTASTALVTVLATTLGNNAKQKYVKISAPATGIAWNMDCAHAAEDGKARTVAKLFAHQKTSSLIVQVTVLVFSMCTLLREMVPKRLSRCRKCFCAKGYTGAACNLRTCSKECEDSPHSDCHDGVCYCKQGFGGDFCTQTLCLKDCGGHGVCKGNGTCECYSGWKGKSCEIETCTDRCTQEWEGVVTGVCNNNKCKCQPGYHGKDCKQKTCAYNCNEPNGFCNGADGECYCTSGFGGVDCSIELVGCPNKCGGRGTCVGSPKRCQCEDGWKGIACEVKDCPNKCSGNGECAPGTNGKCNCKPGWYGADCSCGHECLNGGVCEKGICQCAHGFRGVNCSHTICENDCSFRGECVLADKEAYGTTEAKCNCKAGFEGDDCSIRQCPSDCHNTDKVDRGVCDSGSVTANKNTLGTTAACTSASKARAEVLSLLSL